MNHVASEIDKQELTELKQVLSELTEIKKELSELKKTAKSNSTAPSNDDK